MDKKLWDNIGDDLRHKFQTEADGLAMDLNESRSETLSGQNILDGTGANSPLGKISDLYNDMSKAKSGMSSSKKQLLIAGLISATLIATGAVWIAALPLLYTAEGVYGSYKNSKKLDETRDEVQKLTKVQSSPVSSN